MIRERIIVATLKDDFIKNNIFALQEFTNKRKDNDYTNEELANELSQVLPAFNEYCKDSHLGKVKAIESLLKVEPLKQIEDNKIKKEKEKNEKEKKLDELYERFFKLQNKLSYLKIYFEPNYPVDKALDELYYIAKRGREYYKHNISEDVYERCKEYCENASKSINGIKTRAEYIDDAVDYYNTVRDLYTNKASKTKNKKILALNRATVGNVGLNLQNEIEELSKMRENIYDNLREMDYCTSLVSHYNNVRKNNDHSIILTTDFEKYCNLVVSKYNNFYDRMMNALKQAETIVSEIR